MPAEPEVHGTARAHAAHRSPARGRTTTDGELVRLADQDAGSGIASSSPKGRRSSAAAWRGTSPVPTRFRRPSTPCTASARGGRPTDWTQILQLYDHLLSMTPTPSSRSIAPWRWPKSRTGGGPRSRRSLDLDRYHLFHAIRADLLQRLGRRDEASQAFERAIALTENARERAFLEQRRQALRRG